MRKVGFDITCVRCGDHGGDYDRWTCTTSYHLVVVVVKVLHLEIGRRRYGNNGILGSSIDPFAEKLGAVKGAWRSHWRRKGEVGGSLHQLHGGIGAREGFGCSSRGARSWWRLLSKSRHGKTSVGTVHGEGSSLR